ncbi:hypothetical protein [Kosakonia oryzendophytica]|nr:hypothetical protein [Kosakonia oryzendophytica]WBT57057.1 hypothetical protein O9K67_18135 [Kosakonia oryzendophytica]
MKKIATEPSFKLFIKSAVSCFFVIFVMMFLMHCIGDAMSPHPIYFPRSVWEKMFVYSAAGGIGGGAKTWWFAWYDKYEKSKMMNDKE